MNKAPTSVGLPLNNIPSDYVSLVDSYTDEPNESLITV